MLPWLFKANVPPSRVFPLSVRVTVPVASRAQPVTTPPGVNGWQLVAVPVLFRTSTRKRYGDPYTKLVALVMSGLPAESRVTMPSCRLLASLLTVTVTPVGSSLGAKVPSPA